jgi:hypothetical protein
MARDKSGASSAAGWASTWPVPAALEGAKSRKRAIFKTDEVKLKSGDKVISITGLSLSLESRVAALGTAGRDVLSLLLREEEPECGETWEHKGLSVVHLGPHLAKEDAASPTVQDHMAAMERALRGKPQIIVLEEACAQGGAAWACTFRNLLRSEGLASFKGAVVVCAHEETIAVRKVCEERWALIGESSVRQEAITGKQLDVLEDVMSAHNAARALEAESTGGKRGKAQKRSSDDRSKADEIAALLDEARALSEYCFEEDEFAADWTVTLLTEATQDGVKSLRGFICYKMYKTADGEPYVYIARMAVPKKCRKCGYAGKLMRWLLSEKARLPASECSKITCSALQSAAPFYAKFGFQVATAPAWKAEEEEDPEDPQTWMEFPNYSLI